MPENTEHVFYAGGTWWRIPGTARAAVPGTSNHGWGLAVDTALGDGPTHARSIAPAIPWLVDNAERFGWSWESQDEPWHIHYWAGDEVPDDVRVFTARLT